MSYRGLAVLPLLWGVLFAAIALALGETRFDGVVRVEIEAAKALSLVGSLVATYAFSRGDYLRRGWGFTAACAALLLVRDVAHVPGLPAVMLGVPKAGWEAAVVFAANAISIPGVVILARTWTVAGLEPAESKLTRGTVMLVAAVIALAVAGPAMYGDVRAIGRGELEAISSLFGDVADGVSLVLIAPVLLTALALRGGVLWWPWALLTASLLFWLGYDAGIGLRHVFGAPSREAALAIEVLRGTALLFTFTAGLAQRRAVSGQGADTTVPPP
jgi:hypothetical protein